MNTAAADRIAKAVLYEGYMLYPYRPSSVKNQQRFNFGVLYPRAFSEANQGTEPWTMRAEWLVEGTLHTRLEFRVRFLQLGDRAVEQASGGEFRPVKSLAVDEQTFYSWQEAVEREIEIPVATVESLVSSTLKHPFQLPSTTAQEDCLDSHGVLAGRIVRTQQAIDGCVSVTAYAVSDNVFKISLCVENFTVLRQADIVSRDQALLRSLVSAHVLSGVEEGQFVSLLDPPPRLKQMTTECRNQGVFPVLVGEEGQRDTMLASPIILYDYPQVAPESAGDLFDGTEIDEILSLRILTMTDEEKREMSQSDQRARQMLERTENLPAEQFAKLHGALRTLRPVQKETQ
jgi:hydrogenase maturation protease